jgi:hypothetical protein
MKLLRFVQLIEVMQFLHWRHPEIGMSLQLPIKPGCAGFLRTHAQEIGAWVTGETVKPPAMAIVPIAIPVSGFEWPHQTHRALFSLRALKGKPRVRGCSEIQQRRKLPMEKAVGHRIFLLSPAYAGGERARMILREQAQFPLARRLRGKSGVPIADVFTFLSGLYFRGKIAYATVFARPARGTPGVLVITPTRGLISARTRIRLDDLREFAEVDIHESDPRYRVPIERDARGLATKLPTQSEVVLLGSIATGKYIEILLANFGDRLRFPAEFVGRGDMSRGGLMLRCAVDGQELSYLPVAGAIVNGKRPPKLAPRRYTAGSIGRTTLASVTTARNGA